MREMLAPDPWRTARRRVLLSVLASTVLTACSRISQPPARVPTPPASPLLEGWRTEAASALADGLQALRTFDVFAAYRASTTEGSDRRSPAELAWDPPSGADWDSATHTARALRGRADQLFQAITREQVAADLWREQRDLADITHDLSDVGDALAAYRDRVDRLQPRDASAGVSLLDAAWAAWDQTASRLGLSRSEPIGCGN
jgi:hypothetical protein